MEREDIIYHAKNHFMTIREATVSGQPLGVREKRFLDRKKRSKTSSNIRSISTDVYLATARKARKSLVEKKSQLFSISLSDVQKALASVKKVSNEFGKFTKRIQEIRWVI